MNSIYNVASTALNKNADHVHWDEWKVVDGLLMASL